MRGNAAGKGADVQRMKTSQASRRKQCSWQLHPTTVSADVNGPAEMIANADVDQTKDKFFALRLRITKSGEGMGSKERNGFNKTYTAK